MTNFWNTILGKVILFILPALRNAVRDSFNKLPQDQQMKLIQISKLVEVIKLTAGKPFPEALEIAKQKTGVNEATIFAWLKEYFEGVGHQVDNLQEAFGLIWADMSALTSKAGRVGFFSGLSNALAFIVSDINWEAIALGLLKYVYDTYVKNKVKV